MTLSARRARALLLFVTLLVAVCGFVYELVLISLGSFLVGNTILQTSLVLASFVTTMGLGSLVAKPLQRSPVRAFLIVETLVATVGGSSAIVLYAAFAWLDLYQPMLFVVAAVIGVLVGCEIPLLVTLVQRVRLEAAGRSVADLLAADYLGAMVAGLAFPLLILPAFGEIQSAILVGCLNAIAGLVVVGVFFREHSRPFWAALLAPAALALVGLGVLFYWTSPIEASALQQLYDDPIVSHVHTPYQDIVITQSLDRRDVRLFLNGDLQFSSLDEYRYHESLVHPAMAGPHQRVIVLGGGDGLAMREILRYRDVASATEVEIDPQMIRIARTDPLIASLNRHSLDDRRVHVVEGDAFSFVRTYHGPPFDVAVADFPDPDSPELAKLYSREFYAMIRARLLAPGGRLVVQAGSPYFARKEYWCVERTMRAAGLVTVPYHVDVPSFGDWGFVLGGSSTPRLALQPPGSLRFLTPDVLQTARSFPLDSGRVPVSPSTLVHPIVLTYASEGWQNE